jgi:hypothetical protein
MRGSADKNSPFFNLNCFYLIRKIQFNYFIYAAKRFKKD